MIQNSKKVFQDKQGVSTPAVVAMALALLMIFMVVSEYIRVQMIATGVRDALQSAIISTANDNYDDVYHSVREGYASGHQPSNGTFETSLNQGDIYYRLQKLLGLNRSGNGFASIRSDGSTEYVISGLTVKVENTPLAPSDPQNTKRFSATATLYLEVPVSFAGTKLPPLQVTIKTKASYIQKF